MLLEELKPTAYKIIGLNFKRQFSKIFFDKQSNYRGQEKLSKNCQNSHNKWTVCFCWKFHSDLWKTLDWNQNDLLPLFQWRKENDLGQNWHFMACSFDLGFLGLTSFWFFVLGFLGLTSFRLFNLGFFSFTSFWPFNVGFLDLTSFWSEKVSIMK